MRVGPWMKKPWVILLFVLMLTTIGYAWYRIDTRNFQTVVSGTVYRSGQLTGGQWAAYLQKYAIKSLLNLRGERRVSGWYQEEMRMAIQLGVTHYDVTLAASREVDSGMIETILALMRQAPKPLLIHCRSGADRSGLIAAMYLFAIEGQRAEVAAQQLSIFYGHFPYLFSRSGAMDRSFWRYVGRQSLHSAAAGQHERLQPPTSLPYPL